MKKLSLFLFFLLCSGSSLLAQDVIRVKKQVHDTCGIQLVADTTLLDQTVRLSRLSVGGLKKQKEMEDIRSKLDFQQSKRFTVSMDSICKYVRPILETKKSRLLMVKVIHIDEPNVTDFSYAMLQLIYGPKEKQKTAPAKTEEEPE